MFEIRVHDEDLKRLEKTLAGIPRAMPRVMSRGLNRTAQQARTQTGRSLAKRTGLRVKDVRQRTILSKATYSRWRAAVSISTKRIPLIRFKAKQKAKGVTYKQPDTGKRVLIRHAFISVMPSGHRGVFRRATSKRLPIVEQVGSSLKDIFSAAQEEAARIYTESAAKLARNIHDQVELILRRKAG